MKRFISLLVVLSIVLSLCSCSLTKVELSMGVSDVVESLDPIKAKGDAEKIIAANCFEGLVRFNEDNNIHLANATSYSVDKTGKIYTFNLNPKAKYHISETAQATIDALGIKDFNSDITAEDYVYAIKRYFVYGNGELNNIKGGIDFKEINAKSSVGVKAKDTHTLVITLNKPDPDFLFKLASLPVYPCDSDFVTALGDIYATTPGTLLSNGPFYVENTEELEVTLKSCSDYNGLKRTKNTTVTLYTTGNEQTYKDRFQLGTYDVYLTDSSTVLEGEYMYNSYSSTVWGIGFNSKSAVGQSKTVRDILFKTLDTSGFELPEFGTSLAKRIIPDSFILKENIYGAESEALKIKTDIKSSQAKLKKHLKNKKVTEISIAFAFPTELKTQASKILENWNMYLAPEFKISPVQYNLSKVNEFLSDVNYDIAIMPVTCETPTALNLLEKFSENPINYENKKLYNSLCKRQNFDSDLIATYENAEEKIVEENIFFPLFYSGKKLYLGDGVTGVYAANNGEAVFFHSAEKIHSNENKDK